MQKTHGSTTESRAIFKLWFNTNSLTFPHISCQIWNHFPTKKSWWFTWDANDAIASVSDSALNPKDTLHCGHLHKSATTNVQVAPSCQEPSCSCFPAHQRFLMHKVPTWPKGLASPLWRGLLSRFSPSSLHAVLAHFLRISARQLPWPEHTFCTSPHPTCCSNVTFSGRPALTLYLKSQSHRSPRLDLFS